MMARIPLDPRLSRMLIEARQEGCLEEIAVIAAALSLQDPRERPAENTAEADRAHAAFNQPHSDFLTLLAIWKRFQQASGGQPERRGRAALLPPSTSFRSGACASGRTSTVRSRRS